VVHERRGFTLIELLVAMSIIGILAFIAFPAYVNYRQRSYDAHALYDLRNAAHGEELYFIDTELYHTCSNEGCLEVNGGLPGMRGVSESVSLEMIADNEGAPMFTGEANSSRGSGRSFTWDSTSDGDAMQSSNTSF